jgi:conjugative transfer pilus assembly protein TraH
MIKLIILFLSWNFLAHGDAISKNVSNFYKSVGALNNINRPKAYGDQSVGYYSGGGLRLRTPSETINPVNITLPSVAAGCDGIDMFTGSFSFLKAKELVNVFKKILAGAPSMMFNVALDEYMPSMSNNLKYLNNLAQMVNSTNINSCQSAANIAGGLMPKTNAAAKLVCANQGIGGGLFEDFARARQECNNFESRQKAQDRASKSNGQFVDLMGEEFNLVWKALKSGNIIKDDKLAEFFMTISGTLIVKHDAKSKTNKSFYYPSKLKDHRLFDLLLDGSNQEVKFPYYRCSDNKYGADQCLMIKEEISTASIKGFLNEVESKLASIQHKLYEDKDGGTLSGEEESFVNATHLPIFQIMSINTNFRKGAEPISHQEYAEAVAYDILLHWFNYILDAVNLNIDNLRQAQIIDAIIEQFKKNIKENINYINHKRTNIYKQMQLILNVVERAQQIEKQFFNNTAESANRGI